MTTAPPPTEVSIHRDGAQRMGFFTDTTVCIGCKACEVACKQWNDLPADGAEFRKGGSYDHTGALGAVDLAPRALRRAARADAGEAAERLPRADGRRRPRRRAGRRPSQPRRRHGLAGSSCPTSASTARTPAAWTPARPARSSAPSSRRSSCSPTSATAAATACPPCPFGVVDRDPDRRPRRQVHALLRPPRGRPRARVREGLPDRLDPVRPVRRAGRASRRAARREAARPRAWTAPTSTAPATARDEQLAGGLGAFFLLTEPPERYGLPAQADSPIQENVVPATLAAWARACRRGRRRCVRAARRDRGALAPRGAPRATRVRGAGAAR